MRFTSKGAIALASAGLLAATLAGCSMGSGTTSTPSSAAASSAAPAPVTTPTPLASISSVTGVHTQVALDAGFLKAITTLHLTPGVVGTATLSKAGVLTFPITGGNVKYFDPTQSYRPYVQGEIDHNGSGISLSAGGTTVKLTNFVVHPGSNSNITGDVTVNGKTAATGAMIFTLDGSTLKPLTKDSSGDAILTGTTVYVSPTAASLLNSTFKTTAVTDKLEVGIATITVK